MLSKHSDWRVRGDRQVRAVPWKRIYTGTVLLLGVCTTTRVEAKTDADIDQRIRRIVGEMMQAKDAEIAELKARIKELETQQIQKTSSAPPRATAQGQEQSKPAQASAETVRDEPLEAPPTESKDSNKELKRIKKDVEKLKQVEEERLKIYGFFDMSARAGSPDRKTFDFGSIEMDIEFSYLEHFAGSGAFVWDGDKAEATVAMVDYHQFDHRTPPRGRIFIDPGFHIQGGKFDIPYGLDYQYFAARDRLTVTAPLTTERIQMGGYNSEGVRSYGRWENFDYSVFWVNPLYSDKGNTLGGRLGVNLGHYPYHMSGMTPDLLGLGFSFLADGEGNGRMRSQVYGADFNINYEALHLWSEALWRDASYESLAPDGSSLGRPTESAYHVTMEVDLERWVEQGLYVFGRYGNWSPVYRAVVGEDGEVYAVQPVDRLTLGLGWKVNDYVRLKFEYEDSLGTKTEEPMFVKRIGLAQLVVSF